MAAGRHCILELYDCPVGLLDDERALARAVREASEAAGATVLQLVTQQFEPHGVTAVALLAESHLSVHTWPEFGYAAVDMFTCGQTTEPERACEVMVDALRAGRHDMKVLDRGAEVGDAIVPKHMAASHKASRGVSPR